MKKIFSLMLGALTLVGLTSCPKPEPPINLDDIVEDGFYVVGEATPFASLEAEGANAGIMAAAINEVDKQLREGMYEKYIVLEGGKDFQLVLKEGSEETIYGAELTEGDQYVYENGEKTENLRDGDAIKDSYLIGTLAENTKMRVETTGLYHIILDLNKNNDLADKYIIVCPVNFGLRGTVASWTSSTPADEVSAPSNDGMTFVWNEVECPVMGELKFAHGNGWKVLLDEEGLVKFETSLGENCVPGAGNIELKNEEAAIYKITLTFKLAQGDVKNSFSWKAEKGEALDLPKELYYIGNTTGWEIDQPVAMIPTIGEMSQFWTIAYLTADDGFKFLKEVGSWDSQLTGLVNNIGTDIKDGNGNIHVAETGNYFLMVDFKTNTVVVEPAVVYGCADGFGGWPSETFFGERFETQADGTMTATVKADNNIRMYVTSENAPVDWWKREFNIFDNKIEFRTSDELEAVPATAGQVVTLNFNARTGSVE